MAARLLVPTVLLAAALSGCSDDGTVEGPPTPSAGPPSSAAPSAAATTAAPFPADTLLDTGAAQGGPLGLKAVRAAAQQGFDRVVFELAGTAAGHPGWRVEYVATPISDGSGNPVTVRGSAFLQVILTGVGYPADTGVPEPRPTRFTPATALVKEIVVDGVFEGQCTAFIGLGAKKPFRVFRLGGPERVVVDVQR